MSERHMPTELKFKILDYLKIKCKICGNYMIDRYKKSKLCSYYCWVKFNLGWNDYLLFLFYKFFYFYYNLLKSLQDFSDDYADYFLDDI